MRRFQSKAANLICLPSFYAPLLRSVAAENNLFGNFCVIVPPSTPPRCTIRSAARNALQELLADCSPAVCVTLKGMQLSSFELRVLGALIEKEITTPDLYPLSLNALQSATNQRSSRDPVLDLTEDDVRQALHALEAYGLASAARGSLSGASSRVSKYEQHARTVLNLRRDETALLCLLLLRGPQTPGELRSRADRLFSFDDLSSVSAALDRLANRPTAESTSAFDGPLVVLLPRQPGSREARYAHLLGRSPASSAPIAQDSSVPDDLPTIVASLERRISSLEERLRRLESPDQPM